MKRSLLTISFILVYLFSINACMKKGPALEDNDIHISRANQALDAWQINLEKNVIGATRNTQESNEFNPKNWITISDESCQGEGIPDALAGSCGFGQGAVGITAYRYYSVSGKIADTTIVIYDDFMNDPNETESQKLSVYIHELGHALGLEHICDTSYVMYWTIGGSDTPNANEINAVQDAYYPTVQAPTFGGWENYYNQTTDYACEDYGGSPPADSGSAVRQYTFPVFYIGTRDSTFQKNQKIISNPGKPLKGDITIVVYYYMRDGRTIKKVIK